MRWATRLLGGLSLLWAGYAVHVVGIMEHRFGWVAVHRTISQSFGSKLLALAIVLAFVMWLLAAIQAMGARPNAWRFAAVAAFLIVATALCWAAAATPPIFRTLLEVQIALSYVGALIPNVAIAIMAKGVAANHDHHTFRHA